MTDLEIAKKAFEEKNWAEGIAAAKKTDLTDPWILFYMGYCYNFGCGVEKDYAEAMKWYQKSAAGGDSDAMRNIGMLYQKGQGVEKDLKTAYEWFLKAANAGDGRAMDKVGESYFLGKGVEKNYKLALAWYLKGVHKGVPNSMFSLGWMYEHGRGVEVDLKKAAFYYKRAKAEGHELAAQRLEKLKAKEILNAWIEKEEVDIDDVMKELDELVGIEPVKNDIRKLIDFFKLQTKKKVMGLPVATSSYHCVFSGSPGTGKTTVARIMARAYNALGVIKTPKLVEAQRADLVAEYVGQTAPKTNAIVNKALDGVLFIDEAYSLAQEGGGGYGHEAVDTLLKRMEDDRDRLVVIVAGYTDEMHKFIDMNPGLKSRFTRYINFPDYSADELTEIIVRMGKKEGYAFAKDAIEAVRSCMVEMVEKKEKGFGNAREARTFFDRVKERQAPRVLAIGDAVTKEQMMEILPCDVSDTAGQKEGTNPYDIISEAAKRIGDDELFGLKMICHRSVVKRCAYATATQMANWMEPCTLYKKIIEEWRDLVDERALRSLYAGFLASVEYKLHPLELDARTVVGQIEGLSVERVRELAYGKLGASAPAGARRQIEETIVGAVRQLASDVAERDGVLPKDLKRNGPKQRVNFFRALVYRESYATFLIGFAIGRNLQREGALEVTQDGITVRIEYRRHLNLALAQNEQPVIEHLRITNRTGRSLGGCVCRISCPEGFLLAHEVKVGVLHEGTVRDAGTIQVRFNVAAFRKIASVETGYLRVEVATEDGTKFRHDYRFDAYAPDQSHDILEHPALLAAYVLPQDADVKRLQAKASDLLGRMTNNPSIDAYQGDCERVAKICRALFETVRDKYIHYAEAPADFGLPGQKLRLPHEIMKYKLATCLDTTLLLAALAEACKLHPVVVLVHGHAYLGVFLVKKNLSEAVVRKPDELRRFCRANEMVMIETTGVCHGVTFAAACETGRRHLDEGDDGDFECAIDVVQAHSYGVRQLSLGKPDDVEDRKLVAKEASVSHGAKEKASGGLTEAKLAKMKKPAALVIDGEKVANVSTWKELFQKAYERLNELDASKFDALPDDAAFAKYFVRLSAGKKTPHDCFKVKLGSRGDIRAHELANKVYLWRTDYYFRKLLDHLGIDASRLDVV